MSVLFIQLLYQTGGKIVWKGKEIWSRGRRIML